MSSVPSAGLVHAKVLGHERERERKSKECSRDQEKGNVFVCWGGGGCIADRQGRKISRGSFRWALVSRKALDVIPKQGRDSVRAVFGGSLSGCSLVYSVCLEPMARPTQIFDVISMGM